MIVIDSSIALQWVLPEPNAERSRVYLGVPDAAAPDIALVEVANVLAKKVRFSLMTGEEAREALSIVEDGLGRIIESPSLVPRALDLSVTLNHPVYDCVFLACAERIDGKLATRDQPFIKRVVERGLGHLLESTA